MSQKALALALLTSLVVPAVAHAQDEEGYEEEEDGAGKKRRGVESAGQIREIARGFYAKTNVGAGLYLGSFSQFVNPGTYVGLAVGQDFVDNEKQSMAWEISLGQGLHNGADAITQSDYGCYTLGTGSAPCTQGDLRTYTLAANYEFSYYPTRRVGIGVRAGAGVMFSPLLIEPGAYEEEIIGKYFLGDPGLHNAPKPVVFGGPTFEYYTKLSHFSVGVDVDVFYGIGWDLGLNATGALKYTF